MPRQIPHSSRRCVAPAFLFVLFSSVAPAADFAQPEVQSLVGEPLFAEVLLTPAPGERIDARCLRVVEPTAAFLPVLRQASLRVFDVALGDERKLLRLETRRALLDPAVSVTIEVDCGVGRQRHELPLTLRASATPARPVESVGNAGDSLLRPTSPAMAAVRARRPVLVISAVPGEELSANARAPQRTPVRAEIESRLQLSTSIGLAPVVTDTLRQALRLEYQLLQRLNEQLYAHTVANLKGSEAVERTVAAPQPVAVAEVPVPAVMPPQVPPPARPIEETAAEKAADILVQAAQPASPVPAAPIAVAPLPVSLPKAAAEPPQAEEADWMFPVLGGVAVLLLGAFLVKRRRPALPPVPASPEFADTVLITHDIPASAAPAPQASANGAANAVSAQQMDAFFSTPAATALAPAPAEASAEDESSEPVMELAEIMLSFGRLQGAAQTLQEYIDAHPGEDLQPWVKLLEIYRSGEMRQEFEELSLRFNHNFNVELQHWDNTRAAVAPADDAPPKALSVEEIPHIRDQIVQLWGQPACVDYLRKLLHDNRGGQRSGFRLPVVQEILFLLDIAVVRES